MLVIQALFRNGQFIPENPVSLPENSKVSITIEEKEKEFDFEAYKKLWDEIIEEIENSDEVLPDNFPMRVKFRTPEELGLND
jgi:predicted DNA-binding antitoxin AbrB/MazE fold protein